MLRLLLFYMCHIYICWDCCCFIYVISIYKLLRLFLFYLCHIYICLYYMYFCFMIVTLLIYCFIYVMSVNVQVIGFMIVTSVYIQAFSLYICQISMLVPCLTFYCNYYYMQIQLYALGGEKSKQSEWWDERCELLFSQSLSFPVWLS